MFRLVVFLCALSTSFAVLHLKLVDCNHSPNKIVHFEHAHLSADPVHIPGPETGTIDVQVLQPIAGNHFQLNVHVSKKVLFGYVGVPCISNVGSCHYELCDLLSGRSFNNTNHCPNEILTSTPDFPCACPFKPGTYHLNPTTFIIPELAGVWKFLASGDYKAHAEIKDTSTNEIVGCYDVQVSTEADCSGLGCIFGKK
ncbi:ganglioside GM2 activator-like isoform X1 [Ruditapes philippinarum]|uniref:ganglioside GM2 activator-like isoform X1 n=1 Tax=Ruditapes philippinarum TaxID=129788 RepID=UPI00295BE94B|nr:ganglioside GM2 activator-like isoform X1 [Ruditapes philippinarum]